MCYFVNSSLIILFLCFWFISAHSLTPCQAQKKKEKAACGGMMGCHTVQCTSQGGYSPMQCHGSTGYCWCVDKSGKEIPNTRTAPGHKPPSCTTEEGENNRKTRGTPAEKYWTTGLIWNTHTEPDAVRSKKQKNHTNLSREETPLLF